MAAKPRCHTDKDEDDDNKKFIIRRKCCLLTAMVSRAFPIGEGEHIFQASDKFLVAAEIVIMTYLD
jgi:hypothetical protein